jgi:hypothetical protein
MFRGRAADKLAGKVHRSPVSQYTECPHENLRDPGRVHIDALGNLHICQGISLGNIFERSMIEICDSYDPLTHPIIGPLIKGGPYELANLNQVEWDIDFADACHLCYETRKQLRSRFPEILTPDQMYGSPL